ncbi:hypothetical protein NDU88_001199 [Pleurodeles waltl]|uniref:Uncharacterized protein n=1 Tax=Pleurodeles waltl TaxID=8319 RepID=A0AAV7R6G7_PLEWA|nr:hypothetical protein NDU88_001199 [Pleurodeles waltl]
MLPVPCSRRGRRPPLLIRQSTRHFVRGTLRVVFTPLGAAGLGARIGSSGSRLQPPEVSLLRRGGPLTASYAAGAPAILCVGRSVRSSLLLELRDLERGSDAPGATHSYPKSPLFTGEGQRWVLLSG